jgi:phenylalanyl-tRNA synthetase beta chain
MEEVARRAGYDQIPVTFPAMSAEGQAEPKLLSQRRRIRELLTGMGFTEAINYSFIHGESCRRLRLPESDSRCRQLAVLNPLSEDQAVMRTSLVPGLLETMRRNLSRQSRNLKLFETGKVFISNGSNAQPDEIEMLAGLWTGDRSDLHWHTKPEPCDFYDLKGAVEGLLDGLRVGAIRFTGIDSDQSHYTQPGAAAQILSGDERLGLVGQVHPQVLATYDLRQEAFIFELDMLRLGAHIPEAVQSQPLPRFPSTTRDVTLIVEKDLEADTLPAHVRQMGETLLEEVRLVAVFTGQSIAQGFKSVSLRLVYRSAETTLEDAAVNELHMRIVGRLMAHFKAQLSAS